MWSDNFCVIINNSGAIICVVSEFFFSGCIQPRAHTRVYVYATPLGLILMQSVRQSRRDVIFIGRGVRP